ncbi:hypothetical protein QZH41_015173, partial [Actinostola sp. cb2023]
CRVAKESKQENPEESKRIIRGLVAVLIVWLEQFSSDFNDPPNYSNLKRLNNFVDNQMDKEHKKDLSKKIKEKLQTFIITPYESEGDPMSFRLSMLKDVDYIVEADKMRGSYEGLDFNFLAINPTTFAEQLTLMDAECRELKNFSSLKAIISGLQSASIHRLKKSWMHVPRDSQLLYAELASIFSEDKNQKMSRDLLRKEGTAKRSETEVPGLKRLSSLIKRRSRFFNLDAVMQGTVPYLGTFLTDLMMVDTAHPDYVEVGTHNVNKTVDEMINFRKRRVEFEIIAQIKLLQEAAKNYTIVPDERFRHSFDCLMTFTEAECFNISCEIEKESIKKRTGRVSLRRNRSEPDIASLDLNLSPNSCVVRQQESKSTENSPVLPRHKRNNSSDSTSSSSATSSKETSIPKRSSSPCFRQLASRASSPPAISVSPPVGHSFLSEWDKGHIIRVSLEDNHDSGLLYKGVWLGQNERTSSVIQKCLQKHSLHDRPTDYYLVQQLTNDNELVFPDNCNVYYAMKSKAETLTFQLRRKKV